MIPVFNQEDKRKAIIVQFIGGVYINLVQNGSLSKLDYWKTWPVEEVLANYHIRPIDGAHWLVQFNILNNMAEFENESS